MDDTFRVRERQSLLTTFVLPGACTCAVIDPAERAAYVGGDDGSLVCLNFYSEDNAIAIGGDESVVNVGSDKGIKFHGAQSSIRCLAQSYDASILASGEEDGNVRLWDVPTRQLLKTLKQHPGPVSFLAILLQPEDFKEHSLGKISLPPLKRTQNQRDVEEHEIWMQIHGEIPQLLRPRDDVLDARSTFAALNTDHHSVPIPIGDGDLKHQLESVTESYEEMKQLYDKLYKEHMELRLSL